MAARPLSLGNAVSPARGLAAVRARVRPRSGAKDQALRVVYAGILAYAALFVFAAILHFVVFRTARADLGNMVQPIWNTLHGRFLELTTVNGHQEDRFGIHVEPFLLLLTPVFWIWPSPLLLPIVQALAVASGALPVFWLARKHLQSSTAGANFAFAYLLYPATQFNAFTISSGFHSVSVAVPAVLYAVWFLDEDRLVAFSGVALLAASTKEEIALAVGCLGIWYGVRTGRWIFGISVFAVGLALTLFDFLWVIPHFSPSGANPFAGRYAAVGGTPRGMVHKLFTDPMAFLHAVATGHKAVYLALMFLPFLGLCLLEPLLLLGVVPDLAINLLSSKGDQTSVGFFNTAGIVPFVVVASIFGAAHFKRQAPRISLCVLAAVALVAIYSPIFFLGRDVGELGAPLLSTKAHALSLIPAGVPVSASNQLGGHLSEREYVAVFPYVKRARWIIVDRADPTYADANAFRHEIRKYESDQHWQTVFSSHGVTVLHRRGGTSASR